MNPIDERYFHRQENRDWEQLTNGQQAQLAQEAMEYALVKGKFEFVAEVTPGLDLGRDAAIAMFVMEPAKFLANAVLWLSQDFDAEEFEEMLTSEAMLQTYGSLEGVKKAHGMGMYQMLKTDPVRFMTVNQKLATEYFKQWAEPLYEDEFIHL